MYVADVYVTSVGSSYFQILPVYSRTECEDLLKNVGLRSNRTDYKSAFKHVLDYETARKSKRKKIYCIYMKVLFPRFSTESEQADFVTKFMTSFTNEKMEKPYEKSIPYVYWLSYEGIGEYINILACQRAAYPHLIKEPKRYKKRTYIHKKTHRYCTKDDPNVVIYQKGDVICDELGSVVYQESYVSENKDRSFNYCDSTNESLKQQRFNYFVLNLKLKIRRIIDKMCHRQTNISKTSLKTETFSKFDTREKKAQVLEYNAAIREIRYVLGTCMDTLYTKKEIALQLDGRGDSFKLYHGQSASFYSMKKSIEDVFSNKYLRLEIKSTSQEHDNQKKKKSIESIYDFSFDNRGKENRSWHWNFQKAFEHIQEKIKKYHQKYDYDYEFLDPKDMKEVLNNNFKKAALSFYNN